MSTILFIDDDQLALTLFAKTAAIYGHEAVLAASGREGIDLAAKKQPDLVVVDMQMGDMDGISVIRSLTTGKQTASIPVVMLTAGPPEDVINLARQAGAAATFYKPLNFEALQDILRDKAAPAKD